MSTEPESQPIHVWKRRLAFLQEQEAVVSDPAQKFTLREQIAEAQAKIRELAGKEETSSGLQLGVLAGPPFPKGSIKKSASLAPTRKILLVAFVAVFLMFAVLLAFDSCFRVAGSREESVSVIHHIAGGEECPGTSAGPF